MHTTAQVLLSKLLNAQISGAVIKNISSAVITERMVLRVRREKKI